MNFFDEVMESYKEHKRNLIIRKIQKELDKCYSNVVRFSNKFPNDNELYPKLHDAVYKLQPHIYILFNQVNIYRGYLPKLEPNKDYHLMMFGRYLGAEINLNGIQHKIDKDGMYIRLTDKCNIELENFVGRVFIILFS